MASTFNIFGPATNCDIRVGYISTTRGYVPNLTRYEANQYAKKDPGTTFILRTRDVIKYLSINEVNALNPNDILPRTAKGCNSCSGPTLNVDDPQFPRITFWGGGGVGARGNPVIGEDGSLLTVDLVWGGFGYKTAPQVQLRDDLNTITGTVIKAHLCERPQTTIYYDQEDDYEEYDLTSCSQPDPNNYGIRWGPNGKPLGIWDPTIYANLSKDPIRAEILQYQAYLARGLKPWWDTRKQIPLSITSSLDHNVLTKRTKWDVRHYFWNLKKPHGWKEGGTANRTQIREWYQQRWLGRIASEKEIDDWLSTGMTATEIYEHILGHPAPIAGFNPKTDNSFMNRYAISPVPPSNVPGSDNANIVFTFVWEEDFPYDGEYIFRGMRDNEAKLFIDNVYVPNASNPTNSSSLTNYDAGSGVLGASAGPPAKIKKTMTAGVHQIKVDLLNIPVYENRIIQAARTKDVTFKITTSAKYGNGISIPGLGIDVKKSYKGSQLNESYIRTPEPGKAYDVILTSPETKHGIKLRTAGQNVLQMEEYDDNDWEDLVCSASQGKFINLSGNRCQFVVDAPPPTSQVAPAGSTATQGIQVERVFNTVDFINKANRQLWRTNVYSRGGFINEFGVCPFDTLKLLDDNPYAGSHRIVWDNVKFPFTGNYAIEVEVDDNVNLTFRRNGKDEIKIRKEGFVHVDHEWDFGIDYGNSTGKSTYIKTFNEGTYQLIADLEQIPGGRFGFQDLGTSGISKGNVQARFGKRGDNFYVDVTGSGSAEITFKVKASDTPSSGFAAKEIKIDSDSGNVRLKRNLRKENETITASGNFSAGKRYAINVIGGATAGKGRHLRDDRTIEMFDAGGDNFDLKLTLASINNVNKPALKGINPMALAINIKASYSIERVISPKSWQENPMGLALTIDAPMPPIPQEPMETGEGRCPRNPTWTTRFPGSSQQWWPVSAPPVAVMKDTRWSKFMNRYAISPVPPLADDDTEMSGVTFTNSWPLTIDHDGFYGVKGTADNVGRILINGEEVTKLQDFRVNDPNTTKKYLPKGKHTITVEVSNRRTNRHHFINEKVFNTADWAVVPTSKTITIPGTPGTGGNMPITYTGLHSNNRWGNGNVGRVTDNGKKIELFDKKGNPETGYDVDNSFTITSGNATFSDNGQSIDGEGDVTIELRWWDDPDHHGHPVKSISIGNTTWVVEDVDSNSGRKGTAVHTLSLSTPGTPATTKDVYEGGLVGGTGKDGVTYEGPPLASYRDEALGPSLTPAWSTDEQFRREFMGRQWTSVWRNVYFPIDGQYTLKALADDWLRIYVDDVEIGNPPDFAAEVYEHVRTYNFSANKGKKTIRMEYYNIPGNNESTFWTNPVAFSAIITRKKKVVAGTNSWRKNPIAVSAKVLPPPCPRVVEGKGVVCDIEVIHPGTGDPPSIGVTTTAGYNVVVNLTDIKVPEGGIGYDCETDPIIIEPSNGAVAKPICGDFGQIIGVNMVTPGIGFTNTPTIRLPSTTGTGVRLVPILTLERDPLDVTPDKLIQVTDLVGLKQTGYYNGRPYYGAVFYKDGIRYAGYYETAGQLIQIYDTMQESIDATVTTPPSAIQRQGTDITSNDPRLNIPNTPDNLI